MNFWTYDDASDVRTLETSNSLFKTFVHVCIDALADESTQVDRPPQKLDVPLSHQSLVPGRRRPRKRCPKRHAFLPETTVQQNTEKKKGRGLWVSKIKRRPKRWSNSLSSQTFVIAENVFAEFVNELIKTQVDFGFYFVVQKLFAEFCQGVVSSVVVQVQRVQNAPAKQNHNQIILMKNRSIHFATRIEIQNSLWHRRISCPQDMLRQNPRHAHFDGELKMDTKIIEKIDWGTNRD